MKNKKSKSINIAVISYDIDDFQLWKEENNMIGDGLELRNRFKIKNKTYYCITKVTDLCSKMFNKIIETDNAEKNIYYSSLIRLILKYNMSENKKPKIKLPSDIKMDKKILKIMDNNLVCGTKKDNTEGIVCNKFQTSLEIIEYIKKLTGNW